MGNEQSVGPDLKKENLEKKNHEPKPTKFAFDTPLHQAVDQGDMDLVLSLVQNPETNVAIRIRCAETSQVGRPLARKFLHWAIDRRLYDIIEACMSRDDCDINTRNGDGRTPLQVACLQKNLRLVKMILADPQADENLTVPHLTQYIAFNIEHRSPLGLAAEMKSEKIMRELLTSRRDTIDVNEIERLNNSIQLTHNALLIACRVGFTAGVKLLLDCPSIDVNIQTEESRETPHPLEVACQNSHFGIAKLLLARADLQIQNLLQARKNPLYFCWRKLRIDVARLITEHQSFAGILKKRVKVILKYPPKVDDPLTRAEFIALFCSCLEVAPEELIAADDPAMQLIYSRKKSAYK